MCTGCPFSFHSKKKLSLLRPLKIAKQCPTHKAWQTVNAAVAISQRDVGPNDISVSATNEDFTVSMITSGCSVVMTSCLGVVVLVCQHVFFVGLCMHFQEKNLKMMLIIMLAFSGNIAVHLCNYCTCRASCSLCKANVLKKNALLSHNFSILSAVSLMKVQLATIMATVYWHMPLCVGRLHRSESSTFKLVNKM